MIWESAEGIKQIRAAHDEAYLYLALRFADAAEIDGTVLGLDIRDGENERLPWLAKPAMETADVALRLAADGLEIRRAAWTDELAFRYGVGYGYVEVDPTELEPGSGAWHPPRMILNRPYSIPTTDERSPVEIQNLGLHEWASEGERSLALAQRGDDVVELRIPWAFLGFSDPSSRTLLDPRPDGTIGTEVLAPDGRSSSRRSPPTAPSSCRTPPTTSRAGRRSTGRRARRPASSSSATRSGKPRRRTPAAASCS